jgi:predicted alpha/beta-hydrolase family hydrolase
VPAGTITVRGTRGGFGAWVEAAGAFRGRNVKVGGVDHGVPSRHAVSRLEADDPLVAADAGAGDDGGGA